MLPCFSTTPPWSWRLIWRLCRSYCNPRFFVRQRLQLAFSPCKTPCQQSQSNLFASTTKLRNYLLKTATNSTSVNGILASNIQLENDFSSTVCPCSTSRAGKLHATWTIKRRVIVHRLSSSSDEPRFPHDWLTRWLQARRGKSIGGFPTCHICLGFPLHC